MITQTIVNGLLLGGLFGIASIGFSIVWGVMGVINLAHTAFITVGAYIAFSLFSTFGIDPLLSIPVSIIALFILGYGIQALIINRATQTNLLLSFVVTFGIDLIIINVVILLFTTDFFSVRPSYSGASFEIGGVVIPVVRVIVFALAFLLGLGCYLLLNRTRLGQAIMATALDRDIVRTMGVNPRRIYAIAAGLGAALAGAAGNLAAIIYPVSPFIGLKFIGAAFVVTVLGGIGSVEGCIIAGLLYGLIQALSASVFGVETQEISAFLIFILILLLRPQGLFGKRFFGEH